MELDREYGELLRKTKYKSLTWDNVKTDTKIKTDNIIESWALNLHNTLRIILVELISSKNIKKCNNNEVIRNIHKTLLEKKYPGISFSIKKKIITWLTDKREILETNWLDLKSYIIGKLSESPEAFLSSFIKELKLDFYNPENMDWVSKNKDSLDDIPDQANQAKNNWVLNEFNATIWVLKDEKWNIVANPKILEVFKNNLGLKNEDINNILSYHPWTWMLVFSKTMDALIKREETLYNWENKKAVVTKSFFIPWGWWWLTIARDFFLEEWDLVLVPNFRWPNIDWIISSETKVQPAEIEIINKDWSPNFENLEIALKNSIKQSRKKVSIYLNPPGNPSWTNYSKKDAERLNKILKYFENYIEIQIFLDDPYWVFSLTEESKNELNNKNNETKSALQRIRWLIPEKKVIQKTTTPLSYYIDTSKNISVIEVWSHGTKEAGVYWLRAWVLRVFTNKKKKSILENKLTKACRETFSMSPSLPQLILIKAILWNDIEVFKSKWENWAKKYFDNLSEKELNKRIDKYIEARHKMLEVIYPKLNNIKKEIMSKCSEYLIPMENIQNWTENTWWFVINFTLTEKAKKTGLDLEDIRKSCIKNWKEGIAFTTFEDNINWEKSIRISLFSWKPDIFANRLQKLIHKLLDNKIHDLIKSTKK